jgi:plasmid stabilization system protein ParE
MILVITDEAETDLEHIGEWIAQDSPERAVTFIRELRSRCEALTDMAFAYPLVPEYEHTGIRRRAYGDYLIFYRVVDKTVEVFHVLHGARDYARILFGGE